MPFAAAWFSVTFVITCDSEERLGSVRGEKEIHPDPVAGVIHTKYSVTGFTFEVQATGKGSTCCS